MSQVVRYLFGNREQLLRILSLYTCSHNPEVLEEIQEDGFRIDDDLPAEYAHQRVVGGRFGDNHCRGIRLPELLH